MPETRVRVCLLIAIGFLAAMGGCGRKDDTSRTDEVAPPQAKAEPAGPAVSDAEPNTPTPIFFRLTKESYSPITDTLLLAVTVATGDQVFGLPKTTQFLMEYSEKDNLLRHLLPPSGANFFDWAWVPGQDAFVVVGSDRMILYRRDTDGQFTGTAVSCPVDFFYIRCSWDPNGRWLAVMCNDLRIGRGGFKLGLYDLQNESYALSTIAMKPRRPFWKDHATLYLTNEDGDLDEVTVDSAAPLVARTIPMAKKVGWVYGMVDDQALTWAWDKQLRLGDRTLASLDKAMRLAALGTETCIFVASASTNLSVFDRKGREISRLDPGRMIRLGPVGKDPNTVYGLDGSTLLRISLNDGALRVKELCDLADFQGVREIAGHRLP